MESEVMRGLDSIPTGGNIFHWIFLFSHSKASDASIGIIAILVHFEKTLMTITCQTVVIHSDGQWTMKRIQYSTHSSVKI